MKSNNDEIYDIANDDLVQTSCSLHKIQATALSVSRYLDDIISEPNEQTNNVSYMLDVIEELAILANKNLSETIRKLCAICRETKETEEAK